MTQRLPRAVHSANGTGHTGFEEPGHEPADAHPDVDGVLNAVRRVAADLLASSPQPPSTLNVRVGEVSVEMGWTAAPAPAPAVTHSVAPAGPAGPVLAPVPAEPAEPAGPTLNAATVGTFYRSPAPGAPPFVAEGEEISPGQQVAIIEAMKLMLPVEAERGGRIVEVLVNDGDGVEYGQPLFRLAVDQPGLAA